MLEAVAAWRGDGRDATAKALALAADALAAGDRRRRDLARRHPELPDRMLRRAWGILKARLDVDRDHDRARPPDAAREASDAARASEGSR